MPIKSRCHAGFITALLFPLLVACGAINPPSSNSANQASLPVDRLKVAPGNSISVYARVPSARQMVLTPSGILFVGNRNSPGDVYAVKPDGHVIKVLSGLHSPNGVEFRNGALYVAEVSRILRYDDIEKKLDKPPKPVVVTDSYPKDEHHGWKYIRFGPDGWLYVPIGAPCNVCDRGDPFASITRIHADGTGREIYARGIRNTVGFDWDPKTKQLWFTDNGRDWLGDDKPPDELNHAAQAGLHFGFPFVHGAAIVDPEFGGTKRHREFTPPALELDAHVAVLGMRFYKGDIIYAEHGSWNRAQKDGYRLMRVHIKDGKPDGRAQPFVSGWLDASGNVWGRPVDVVIMPDESLLVSDDFAGAIYRITPEQKK